MDVLEQVIVALSLVAVCYVAYRLMTPSKGQHGCGDAPPDRPQKLVQLVRKTRRSGSR